MYMYSQDLKKTQKNIFSFLKKESFGVHVH
jgi:hypothetical protein